MGNLNSSIDSYNDDNSYNKGEYNRLNEKLDKMKSKLELFSVEKNGYLKSIEDLGNKIIILENENNLLNKENDILNNENKELKKENENYNNKICKFKEQENDYLKKKVFLILKNNNLYVENKELEREIKNNELIIYNYDLNYKYIKYILYQQSKINSKIEDDLNKVYNINSIYLKKNVIKNLINNYLKYNNKKLNEKNNIKFRNIIDYYIKNEENVIKKIMLIDNTIVPDYFEKEIVKNTYNNLLKKILEDLN